MNPISKILDELVAYAVTLADWSWCKGIVDVEGDIVFSVNPCKMVVSESSVDDSYIVDLEDFRNIVPDLNNDATKGCILRMARNKISPWFYVEPVSVRGIGGYIGKVPFLGAPPVTEGMPTEVHAMIAALAGRPHA